MVLPPRARAESVGEGGSTLRSDRRAHRHRVPAQEVPVSVRIGDIEFDNVSYDADGDVLYLHVGSPRTAVDFDESPEGHHIRFGPNGDLVGITILNARLILEEDGKIVVTLPDRRLETSDLGDALAAA